MGSAAQSHAVGLSDHQRGNGEGWHGTRHPKDAFVDVIGDKDAVPPADEPQSVPPRRLRLGARRDGTLPLVSVNSGFFHDDRVNAVILGALIARFLFLYLL
jgi:hypothetical protein